MDGSRKIPESGRLGGFWMLDVPETDWEDHGPVGSWLLSELSVVIVVGGVVSSGELIENRDDGPVGGLLEDIETRGDIPADCSIAWVSLLNEEDE